jgi:AcrR family transcriptional regulator
MIIDHRTQPRRRGQALQEAILDAARAELAEVGYPNLTMERVAARAKASKASVYSRWPSRIELVMDVFYDLMPDPASPPDTGTLRGDLLAAFRQTAELLSGPVGEALRGLLGDVLPDSARTAEMRDHSHQHGRRTLEVIAGRAIERGEINAAAVTPLRLQVGPAMLRNHFLFQGLPVPEAVIVGIVDDIMIPLLQ